MRQRHLTPKPRPKVRAPGWASASWEGGGSPGKVQLWHQERLAVVYVRQATTQQVLEHQESTRLQYGLAARAGELGWATERVLLIDDDLGKSGTRTAGRTGFPRLVSEVSLDHVGLILGVELSRLARSCADWYQLRELCALFGTLLADLDGIYDPSQYNDRLLLGLKGTMSAVEVQLMQQRMRQGLLAKARRGARRIPLPMGYVARACGEIARDPDEQVPAVLRLIFRQFAELGTVHALLRYLVAHPSQLGMRQAHGPGRGAVIWRRPNRTTLQHLLKHPLYAGAYVYGRRPVDPRRQRAGSPDTGRVVAAPADWRVLLRDRLPAYICWEEYERKQARLPATRARADTLGVVREGPALLTRLVVCAHCGRHMAVSYPADAPHPAYECARMRLDYGAERCQHLAGAGLDAGVSPQVLAALAPAALELSLQAAANSEQERADRTRLRQQQVERATSAAARAGRQYHAVEPENRLVARQLEREWEERLAALRQAEEEYQRFVLTPPRGLTAAERAAIRQLATDIPALWYAPTTTPAERKALIRQVVQRVLVAVQGASERVLVTLDWGGGARTDGELVRPVARLEQLSYYPQLCARVRELAADGLTSAAIAQRLNAAGYRPPKRREHFGAQGVPDLLQRLGARTKAARVAPAQGLLGIDEWGLRELAQAIGMPHVTLYNWLGRGGVTARRDAQAPHRWIRWADAAQVKRLRHRHRRSLGDERHNDWYPASPLAPEHATDLH